MATEEEPKLERQLSNPILGYSEGELRREMFRKEERDLFNATSKSRSRSKSKK